MRKNIFFITLIISLLVTACHPFDPEIEQKVEEDYQILSGIVEEDQDDEAVQKNIKWVIQSNFLQSKPSLKGVNKYLKSLGKDYGVSFVMDESKDSIQNFKNGDNYYNYLKKELDENNIDIISFGVKTKSNFEYLNLLTLGEDLSNYKEDTLPINRIIANNLVEELDPKYAIDKSTLVDGKCFGLGNFSFKGPIGFIWDERIVNKEELLNLNPNPWDNMDLLMEYKEKLGQAPVLLSHDYSYFIEGYKVYGDLIVANPQTGMVNYAFDTSEYKKIAEGIVKLRKSSLLMDSYDFQGDNIPLVESCFLTDAEIIDKINNNLYKVKYQGREGYFVKYSYPYQIRNYMNLENGIYKDSKYIEESLDFLNLMYNDGEIVNIFYRENPSLNINRYCNEWLIDENAYVLKEHNEMKHYLDNYNKDYLEGFNFDDSVDEMQDTIGDTLKEIIVKDSEKGAGYSQDYESYRFMTENYLNAIENLRIVLEESGGDNVKEYFQREVNKFMGR